MSGPPSKFVVVKTHQLIPFLMDFRVVMAMFFEITLFFGPSVFKKNLEHKRTHVLVSAIYRAYCISGTQQLE